MATYERPGVSVDQNMTNTPTAINREHPAFVFGPNYELHRYDDGDEKAGTLAEKPYAGSAIEFKYPGAIDAEQVDRGYTKLTGDNVIVKLVDLGAATLPEQNVSKAQRDVNGGYTKLLFAGEAFVNRDENNNETSRYESLPKNLAVGDLLVVSYKETGASEDTFLQTKVASVAYYSTDFDVDEEAFDKDSSKEGQSGTLVAIDDAIPETVDLSSVKVVLAESYQGVEFARKNLADGAGYQWDQPVTSDGKEVLVDEDGVKYFGVRVNALNVEVTGYFAEPTYCPVMFADLYVTFRELVTSNADTLHSVLGSSEVANVLGKVHPDNPLAQGVYDAAINAATDDGDEAPPIYFMAVPSDDEAGYDAVLNRATLTDVPYAFAPTTRNEAVLEKIRSHCLAMSVKTVKQWRIAFVSAEVPETVAKLSSLLDPQGDDFLAIPVSDDGLEVVAGHKYNKFRIVKSTTNTNGSSDTAFRSTLVVGDTVKFDIYRKNAWGESAPYEYIITKIVNNYTVEVKGEIDVSDLTAASDNANYVPQPIEIYHQFTSAEMAEEVAKVSKAMASRRMYNIFPSVFGNDGVIKTGEFAACAVAGLVSATESQQPITNVTVRGIDDVPMVYQQYNRAQLDAMAAGGTFIIAQDLPNDLVYVRHQISTAYPDGNLNTAELSITKNVDDISYKFAQVFRPYYGKYNIVPGLLGILRNKAEDLIDELARDDSIYGPQLIADETEILDISQNQLLKDHVNIKIKLGVPYPCNNIEIELIV